ncbi:fasciclin domain-containing protein [Neolewinella sp.]|uniref:fasciclin domain-containing protein n=1 Tax=Neolewinella sp. TaxID=2993543 RepID=UPI003B5283B6
MKSNLFTLLACLVVMLLMPVTVSAQDDMEQDQTIVQLASENNDLTILVAALNAADLTSTLEGDGPFTVFAPTDEAFRALPEEVFQALLKAENRQALIDILKYHVADGKLAAGDVTTAIEGETSGEYMAGTMNGDFTTSLSDGNVTLTDAKGNNANVTQADIMASNGVIHLIDAVLLPENVDVDALIGDNAEEVEPELGAVDNANGVRRPADEPTNEMIAEGEEMRQQAAEMGQEGQEAGQALEEGMTEAGQEVREAGSEMGQEMTEAGQQTTEAAQEAGQAIEEGVTEAGQEVREAGSEMGQEMTEATQEPYETTQEAGQAIEEGMTEAGQEVQEAGSEMGQEMTEATQEPYETTQEAGQAIEEGMTEAGQEVREAGSEMGQEMNETAQDVRRTTQEVGSDVTQQNQEMSESVNNTDMTTMDADNMGNTTRRSTGADNNTIVDVAAANTDFRTLINAVETAELEDVLASDGEFTVFAPTEAAFGKLPSGTVEGLNKEDLTGVLTYHVIASKISAADLMKAIEANNGYFRIQTMGGNSLVASMQDGNVILTDGDGNVATITDTDIEASNGVIHVIDTVMMPKMAMKAGDNMESGN